MDDVSDGNAICLPNDVLLDILARLPARPLAGCRRVCRAWRVIVDAHDLLLPYYFPRRDFPGIFVSKSRGRIACSFFGPRSKHDRRCYCKTSSRQPVYPYQAIIRNSCNGLLFLEDRHNYYVFNPATARYDRLPCPSTKYCIGAMSLAFDPAVSLHYDVFLLNEEKLILREWLFAKHRKPPSPERVVPLEVYSSSTRQWEIREFTPGPCAPGHLYDMVVRSSHCYRLNIRPQSIFSEVDTYERMFWSSHYWHESLYLHSCQNVLMILRSSNRTYDMVQLPGEPCSGSADSRYPLPKQSVLASYDRGVHYVTINELHLQAWMLTESTDDQLAWTLAHNANLEPIRFPQQLNVTWGVVGSSGGPLTSIEDHDGYAKVKEDRVQTYCDSDCSWNSDEENFVDVVQGSTLAWRDDCRIIGFHPHKNALILLLDQAVVVYHLDTSRTQFLGHASDFMDDTMGHVDGSFIYRGCYADVLRSGGNIPKP